MTSCILGYIYQCFGGVCCNHLQDPRSPSRMLHGKFLLVKVCVVFCETFMCLGQLRGHSTSIVYTVLYVVSIEWTALTEQNIAAVRCLNDKGPTASCLTNLFCTSTWVPRTCFGMLLFLLLWDLECKQLYNFRWEWAVIGVSLYTNSELQKAVDHCVSLACVEEASH